MLERVDVDTGRTVAGDVDDAHFLSGGVAIVGDDVLLSNTKADSKTELRNRSGSRRGFESH